jgi:hypothetical protein
MEDADIKVTERSLDAKVKDAEMGMEAAQDHLLRSLVDGTRDVQKAQANLQKGPHNASVYTFDVPKSNCLTCGRHKVSSKMHVLQHMLVRKRKPRDSLVVQ